MCLHQLLDQVQSEPGSAIAARGAHVHLLKRAEDLTKLVLGDAQASVRHRQEHTATVLAGAAADGDGSIAGELGCRHEDQVQSLRPPQEIVFTIKPSGDDGASIEAVPPI